MDPSPTDRQALERRRIALRRSCREVAGHGHRHAADELECVAAWCREENLSKDVYGEGDFLQSFERRVAELLGFEAARFMPSGTMAQQIALRVWAERSGTPQFGMHPTCHLELHEQQGYSKLHQLRATLIGERGSPVLPGDLHRVTETLSSLVLELPTRENGGQLPSWEQHRELVDLAGRRGIRLHLDGARLWEAQASYKRPFAEICAGFDSAYVSFYKGIGALPGAMLLGPAEFIEKAILWQRRQGGNLFTMLANAASAARRLDEQLAKMPRFLERARELARLLSGIDGVQVIPDPPQVNMFHLLFEIDPERLSLARDQVARQTGLWLVGGVRPGEQPETSRTEVSIYDAALNINDDEFASAFELLLALARRTE